jgi:hypothetical protein
MDDDDLIRAALRDFAYSDPTAPEIAASNALSSRGARRQRALQWATAAVVALVIAGAMAWIALASGPTAPPTEPTPTSTPTKSASPRPSNSPTPPINPPSGYSEQIRPSNGLPTGGLGDTIAGLTLTDVVITDSRCPDSSRCPGTGSLTVENATSQPISAYVYFNVFRNNTPAVGDAARVDLAPGESTTVTIDVQPTLADNAPPGRTGAIYSWNFSVEIA